VLWFFFLPPPPADATAPMSSSLIEIPPPLLLPGVHGVLDLAGAVVRRVGRTGGAFNGTIFGRCLGT
jgi:hypothetical protein